MKKQYGFYVIIVLILFCGHARSMELGVIGGPNVERTASEKFTPEFNSYPINYAAGFYGEWPFYKRLTIYSELAYAEYASNYEYVCSCEWPVESTRRIRFLSVPLIFKFTDDNGVYFNFGLSLHYNFEKKRNTTVGLHSYVFTVYNEMDTLLNLGLGKQFYDKRLPVRFELRASRGSMGLFETRGDDWDYWQYQILFGVALWERD